VPAGAVAAYRETGTAAVLREEPPPFPLQLQHFG